MTGGDETQEEQPQTNILEEESTHVSGVSGRDDEVESHKLHPINSQHGGNKHVSGDGGSGNQARDDQHGSGHDSMEENSHDLAAGGSDSFVKKESHQVDPMQSKQEGSMHGSGVTGSGDGGGNLAKATKEYIVEILIVGGGAQAAAFLAEFSRYKPMVQIRIIVLEKDSKFGQGRAYGSDVVHPEHLMNIFEAAGISIIENRDPAHFFNWARRNPEKLEDFKLPKTADDRFDLPPRRSVVGVYMEESFHEFEQACITNGYEVELINNTAAIDVIHDGSDYIVTLSNNDKICSKLLLLATGHFDYNRFLDEEEEDDDDEKLPSGFFRSPWPATLLTHPAKGIPRNKPVGFLGAGPSSIDTAMTLSHDYGYFEEKSHGFTYKCDDKDFVMTMYSRSGYFPSVGAPGGEYGPGYESAQAEIEYYIEEENYQTHLVPLDIVLHEIKKDMVAFFENKDNDNNNKDKDNGDSDDGDWDEGLKEEEKEPDENSLEYKIKDFWKIGPELFFKRLDELMYDQTTPEGRLAEDEKKARKNMEGEWVLLPEILFLSMPDIFEDIMKYGRFTAEDIITFKRYIAPRILKYYLPMPLRNAEKLLALLDAERLKLVAIGDGKVVPDKTNGGVRVQFGTSDIHHEYFVDATGQSGDMKRNRSPLMKALFREKLIQFPFFEFAKQTEGKKAYDKEQRGDKSYRRVQLNEDNGEYLYRGDGVEMSLDSMSVIPPISSTAAGTMYASGPFTNGYHPFPQAIVWVAKFAERAVKDIVRNHFEEKLVEIL